MFEQFCRSEFLVAGYRSNPGINLLEAFGAHLVDCGYSRTQGARHLRATAHFLYWCDKQGLPMTLTSPDDMSRFALHLDQCSCSGFTRIHRPKLLRGLRAFSSFLQGRPLSAAGHRHPPVEVVAPLWESFCCWMRQQRGISERTLNDYRDYLKLLVRDISNDPSKLDASYLRRFMLQLGQKAANARSKATTSALRMFVRFLITQGQCAVGLDEAIPSLAYWRLTSIPQYLQPDEVERVVNSPDLHTAVGKRDRSILLLLARLGLRAGDVLGLCLADIDWYAATIRVSGKSKRQTLLPLTQEVGDSIVSYLQSGRPTTTSERVFIRSIAPYRPYRDSRGICDVAKLALRRAGVAPERGAAHILRHSMATNMLRQRVSLQDISDVLRHSTLASTQIYAKVDLPALQELAQPWPGVQPC